MVGGDSAVGSGGRLWRPASVGMRFECQRCGRCCAEYPVEVSLEDLRDLARRRPDLRGALPTLVRKGFWFFLGRPGWTFRPLTDEAGNRAAACCFLERRGPESSCRIYQARPLSCRIYPFDLLPEAVVRRLGLRPDREAGVQAYDVVNDCWSYLAYDAHCEGVGQGPPLTEGDLYKLAERCNRHFGQQRETLRRPDREIWDLLAGTGPRE